jgi:hypothetical protein
MAAVLAPLLSMVIFYGVPHWSMLLPAMQPALDIERALKRGRFMTAAARIEYNGNQIMVCVTVSTSRRTRR